MTNRVAQAVEKTSHSTVGISGGVAANTYLREQLKELADRLGFRLLIPRPEYCTDNAAMIGAAGVEGLARFGPSPLSLEAKARVPLA